MKLIRSLVLTAAVLLPASAAFAADNAEFETPTLASELKLTDAQLKQIEAIDATRQKQIDAIKTSHIEPGLLLGMIKSGKWDEKKAKAHIQAIGDVEDQISYIRLKALFDVSKVLTAEQKQKFQEMFKQALE